MGKIELHKPAPALQKAITYYFFIEDTRENTHFTLQHPVANGCIEIFLNYNNTNSWIDAKGIRTYYTGAVVGTHNLKNPIVASSMTDLVSVVSISFEPTGFYSVFNIPVHRFRNKVVQLDKAFKKAGQQLYHDINEAGGLEERVEILDSFFSTFMEKSHNPGIDTITQLINIIKTDSSYDFKELKRNFPFSERTTERLFMKYLGLSPLEYFKINKFLKILNLIEKAEKIDWIELAEEFKYYDQSHLIREFKAATLLTPELFMKFKNKEFLVFGRYILMSEKMMDECINKDKLNMGINMKKSYEQFISNNNSN